MAAASVQEPGCLDFRVHQSLEDVRTFLLYARYRDRGGLDAHRGSAHFETLAVGGLLPLHGSREPHLYQPISD